MKFKILFLTGVLLIIILLLFLGITLLYKHPAEKTIELNNSYFMDGFENALTLQDLFVKDLSRWHGVQKIPETNRIEIDGENVHSGENSLKLWAEKSKETVSKSDVIREGIAFKRGDDLWFSGYFYIPEGTDTRGVFLLDFEDSKLYQGPGRRFYIQEGEKLASDQKGFPKRETFRSASPIIKNKWFNLKVHMFLSYGADGKLEVWQAGIKIIEGNGPNLPSSSSIYDRMQIGITANQDLYDQIIYIDDIIVSKDEI